METQELETEIDHIEGIKKELLRLKQMIRTLESRILDGKSSLKAMYNIKSDTNE